MIETVSIHEPIRLDSYAEIPALARAVQELRNEAAAFVPKLKGRKLWMINSAAQGGGVAEMLPKLVSILNELGLPTHWGVIHTDELRFFELTKRIHNLIHDEGEPDLSQEDQDLYEKVNRDNAASLAERLSPEDILVIHDPQPMALGHMLKEQIGLPTFWRCHIGLDSRTEATQAAWNFLKPYAGGYNHAVFSAPEYIPDYFTGASSIIYPALDPLSHKNRDLSPVKISGVLCDAGLAIPHSPTLTPPFSKPALRLNAKGEFASATEPEEIGFLYRPIVTKISRWDKLKGWAPLLKAFVRMKRFVNEPSRVPNERHRRRLEIVRLVLAGPEPASIQDDPEGQRVFRELSELYQSLSPEEQRDIAILSLPMNSRKENALMVNAIQRCSTVIAQNSIHEGFGLTATEAMWKGVAVLGSQACGLRQQIRDQVDGVLVQNPEDIEEVAIKLNDLLAHPEIRGKLCRSGQSRVHREFLVFNQARRWLEVLAPHV